MKSLGVISKVDAPTPWCTGMVVVPKKNGKVRICVDLKPLNESVLREVHPLTKVDETLAQLTGAKVSLNSMPTAGFGKSLLRNHHVSSQLSSLIWPFPLQQAPVRNFKHPRTLPNNNDSNPQWPKRLCVSNGRCPSFWQRPR